MYLSDAEREMIEREWRRQELATDQRIDALTTQLKTAEAVIAELEAAQGVLNER